MVRFETRKKPRHSSSDFGTKFIQIRLAPLKLGQKKPNKNAVLTRGGHHFTLQKSSKVQSSQLLFTKVVSRVGSEI